MWIIRSLFYFFVAWGCSVTFFDSSILAVIIMVYFLECTRGKIFDAGSLKEQNYNYNIPFVILCIVIGGVLIVVGKIIFSNDYIVILGAAIFSGAVVIGLNKLLIPYIQKLRGK